MRRQLVGFLSVGAFAFVIDAGLLQVLSWAGLIPWIARFFSFTTALVFTWWMNRTHSFRVVGQPTWTEFFSYACSVSAGGAINWLVYLVVLDKYLSGTAFPALALIPATAVSLCFNFLMMKWVVFRKKNQG